MQFVDDQSYVTFNQIKIFVLFKYKKIKIRVKKIKTQEQKMRNEFKC